MRKGYAVAFGGIAVGLAIIALQLTGQVWAVVPAWCGVSALALGHDYWTGRCNHLRKTPDGRLAWRTRVVMLPLLLFARVVWHLQRLVSREPAWNEVVSGLFISRRLLPGELPVGVRLIVDLTAEFPEPPAVRGACEYASFPILDATTPSRAELGEIVSRIVRHAGPVLVHCANGHGRSGMVVAAVLLAKGVPSDAADAIGRVKAARTGVRLNGDQRRAVVAFAGR